MKRAENLENRAADAPLLDQWSRQHRRALERYVAKRAPRHLDVEDVVQEVFVRVARRSDLAAIEYPERYLYLTAGSVIADRLRKRAAQLGEHHVAFDETQHGEDARSPERVLLGKDALERMVAALGELKERTRTVFVLYHFEAMPHADIARALGMSVSTVEKQMAKANKHLLKRFGGRAP